MSNPMVSICVPLYNGGHFIGATISSVLQQSYSNWEMIVFDDQSTDGSEALVRQFVDPRIRYHRNTVRMGMQGNFNRLLQAAQGRYIKLLCQDDLLHPDCLRRQVAVMETPGHEHIVLVTSAREVIDARGKLLFRRRWHRQDGCVPGLTAIHQMVHAGSNLVGEPSAVLFRAADRDRCGGFDGRFPYVIDVDYWIRLLSGGDCYYLATPLCQFRVSRYSGSFDIAGRQGSQFVAYVRELRKNHALQLSGRDVIRSWFGAQSKAVLRQVFYQLYWRRLMVS